MDKPSDFLNGRLPESFSEDSHLSDEVLLLAVDGELPGRVSIQIRAHLEACWSCRARRDRIEKCISDVVGYRNLFLRPYLPPSDKSRSNFVNLLAIQAASVDRPSLWSRFGSIFRSVPILRLRPLLIQGIILLCLVAILAFQLRRVRTVSAGEFLRNAEFSEKQGLKSSLRPVVYQKLRIQSNGHSVIRVSYRDLVGERRADHIENDARNTAIGPAQATENLPGGTIVDEAVSADADFLRSSFQMTTLSWDEPLSASQFRAWHDSVSDKHDEIKQTSSLLTLRTTTTDGPIAEFQFTVRASDYHPISEHMLLRNSKEFDVEELGYEVLSLDAINQTMFAVAAPSPVLAPKPPPAPVLAPPTRADLADAEVQVRAVLHSSGADLGEQLQILQADQVIIHGVAGSSARKMELETLLSKIPHLKIELRSPEDTPSDTEQPEPAVSLDGVPTPVAAPAPLEGLLETRFPDVRERENFIRQVLACAQDASDRAWALRRVAGRYSPAALADLSPQSRRELEVIIQDHAEALRNSSGLLQTILEGFFGGQPADAQDATSADSGSPSADGSVEAMSSETWQSDAEELFATVDQLEQLTLDLLTGSEARDSASGKRDAELLTREWLQTSSKLHCVLSRFNMQVCGDFLNTNGGKP